MAAGAPRRRATPSRADPARDSVAATGTSARIASIAAAATIARAIAPPRPGYWAGTGDFETTPIVWGERLQAGNVVKGPAVIQVPDTTIVVAGHTDSVGSASYNERLSERRADSVAGYLQDLGVRGSRLDAVGYGQSKPPASEPGPGSATAGPSGMPGKSEGVSPTFAGGCDVTWRSYFVSPCASAEDGRQIALTARASAPRRRRRRNVMGEVLMAARLVARGRAPATNAV